MGLGRMNILCSSWASTAICSGMANRSLDQPHIPKPKPARKSTSASSSSAPRPSRSDSRRKSSADVSDLNRMINYRPRPRDTDSSTTYLLSNNHTHFIDKPPTLLRHQSAKESHSHSPAPKLIKSYLSSPSCRDQVVVVLRVSLHCKGCEAKVRKHISKMEGVSWFSIEMETKKVIVVGNVTASSVVASVSTVKNAQLWPSSSPTSSSSIIIG